MVRADPDMIMVGEIRDKETAQIAVESALTGAPGALHAAHQRRALGDHAPGRDGHRAVPGLLGVDCVLAQRLVRTLCSHCKHARSFPRRCCARTATRRSWTWRPTSPTAAGAAGAPATAGGGDLRGDDRDPRDPPPRARAPGRGGPRTRWRSSRGSPPARRRPGEGPPGTHLIAESPASSAPRAVRGIPARGDPGSRTASLSSGCQPCRGWATQIFVQWAANGRGAGAPRPMGRRWTSTSQTF